MEKSDNPDRLLQEIEQRMEMLRLTFRTAKSFLAEEIIDPRDLSRLLFEFANLAAPLRTPGKTSLGLRPKLLNPKT